MGKGRTREDDLPKGILSWLEFMEEPWLEAWFPVKGLFSRPDWNDHIAIIIQC